MPRERSFDAAVPELVAAHVILALYWTHQMDSSKINRCIGLAHQSNGIICDPPPALAASLTFVSVVLFDAKVGEHQRRRKRNRLAIDRSLCVLLKSPRGVLRSTYSRSVGFISNRTVHSLPWNPLVSGNDR